VDPKLLYPLKHRGEESQAHMAIIRSRQALVDCRTQLVNHVRGAVKSFGARLPKCPARTFHKRASEHIPEALLAPLGPILEQIGSLTERIGQYNRKLETISKEHYPENLALAPGRGDRAAHGAYLRAQLGRSLPLREEPLGRGIPGAGASHRPLRREGPPKTHLQGGRADAKRRLLVGSAHYVLGPFGSDSDLRRHGEKIASRGAKNAKKRAAVAVGRKLSVLLHRLWVTGELYDPLHDTHRRQEQKEAA
jgi:transposase